MTNKLAEYILMYQKIDNPQISVIVATRNRPRKLLNFLRSLKKSSFLDFEVIIVVQGDIDIIRNKIRYLSKEFLNFRLVESNVKGKSKGLNRAIALSRGTLLAFTDDDCVPEVDWLKFVHKSFTDFPQIYGVFGKTIPYQPEKHAMKFCPSTFECNKLNTHIITIPCRHWEHIGYGNNMAFRKSVFNELGGFKTWLGPGSIGSNAEDAEIALRCLLSGRVLLYNQKMIIAHDCWQDRWEMVMRTISYDCGTFACYGHLAFLGNKFAQTVIKDEVKNIIFSDTAYIIFLFIHLKKDVFFIHMDYSDVVTIARLSCCLQFFAPSNNK